MNIDEERKNQESEPIAARANTQPRRRGPMGRGGMIPGEKAGDFKGSMLKLLAFMGKFKFALGAVFVVRHRLDRVQHCGPEGSLDSYYRTL